jgi:hypothetical protein
VLGVKEVKGGKGINKKTQQKESNQKSSPVQTEVILSNNKIYTTTS